MVYPDMSHMPGAAAMTRQNSASCRAARPIVRQSLRRRFTLTAVEWLSIHHPGPLFTYPLPRISCATKANVTGSRRLDFR